MPSEITMTGSEKILIVDDDTLVLDALQEPLESHGYAVHTTSSGEQAIECLNREAFDLILLDIVMPGTDGFQVMDHVFQQSNDTLVVVITGYASTESAIEALKRGAYYYLSKPIENEELLKMVENALDKNRLETKRKRAEEALQKAHDELESRLRERTEELSEANKRLAQEVVECRRGEEALKESEEKYRFLTENIVDIIWIVDREFRTTYVSPTIEKLLGFTPEERKQQTLEEMLTPESVRRVRDRFLEELRLEETGTADPDRSVTMEVEYYRKDGSTVWAENNLKAIRDETGAMVGMHGVSRDITERKQAEKALRESEERYRTLVENIPIGVYRSTPGPRGEFLTANPAFLTMFGFDSEEELKSVHVADLYVEPGQREKVSQNILSQGKVAGLELRLRKRDGSPIWGAVSARVVYDEKGAAAYFDCTIEDITERKRAEEELRESENRYRELFISSSDLIMIHDLEGRLLNVNPAVSKVSGYSPKEIVGRPLSDFINPRFRQQLRDQYVKQIREQGHSEGVVVLQTKDGIDHYIEYHSVLVEKEGEKPYISASGRDITERMHAELRLRESEKRYRTILESIEEGYYEVDFSGTLTFVNDALCNIVGVSREELIGMNNRSYTTRETARKMYEVFNQVYRTGEPAVLVDYEIIRKDGSTRVLEISTSLNEDQVGKAVGFRGLARDITERKETEEALRQSEERYRSLVENTMDGYFICEIPSGRFLFLNQRACDLYGYPMEEGLGLTVWDVMSSKDHAHIQERFQTRLGGEKDSTGRHTYTAVSKDGSTFRAEISTSLVTFRGGPAVQGVVRDITEQERLEQQLQQARKMEAIGTLAGGIAHDFNNLLMAIQGNASLMFMDTAFGHPNHERLKNIEGCVKSAADLTRQLLGFARGGKFQLRPTNINELVRTSSEMFGRTNKEIAVHLKLQENIWNAEVDQSQIEQVLLNLYVNAWQAMPGGGELFIGTENVMLAESDSETFKMRGGKYIKISVADTGIGMDEDTQKRIFDPFFTTKEMGRGTGLGLASAYGIVENHGGYIDVRSKEREGAVFTIYLPASEKPVIEKGEDLRDIVKGSENILLVDDEDMVLNAAGKMLEELGYHVLSAESGKEAVELYEANRDGIDMVILDVVMPKMGGAEVYEKLREMNPEVKVLLSSGYSLNSQAKDIMRNGCNGFIQKPYNMKLLSEKVREILNKK
jgi:PAS domain S-box-containing protein